LSLLVNWVIMHLRQAAKPTSTGTRRLSAVWRTSGQFTQSNGATLVRGLRPGAGVPGHFSDLRGRRDHARRSEQIGQHGVLGVLPGEQTKARQRGVPGALPGVQTDAPQQAAGRRVRRTGDGRAGPASAGPEAGRWMGDGRAGPAGAGPEAGRWMGDCRAGPAGARPEAGRWMGEGEEWVRPARHEAGSPGGVTGWPGGRSVARSESRASCSSTTAAAWSMTPRCFLDRTPLARSPCWAATVVSRSSKSRTGVGASRAA